MSRKPYKKTFRVYLVALFISVFGLVASGYLYIGATLDMKDLELDLRTGYIEWTSLIINLETLYRADRDIGDSVALLDEQLSRLNVALKAIEPSASAQSRYGAQVSERARNLFTVLTLASGHAATIRNYLSELATKELPDDASLEKLHQRFLGKGIDGEEWLTSSVGFLLWNIETSISEAYSLFEPQVSRLRSALADLVDEALSKVYRLYSASIIIAAAFFLAMIIVLGVRLETLNARVKLQRDELLEFSRTLESKVDSRTEHLKRTLAELESAQDLLVESEKRAVIGTIASAVAHELNTPLGAIASAGGGIRAGFIRDLQKSNERYGELTDAEKAAFWRLLEGVSARHSSELIIPDRKLRIQISSNLEKSGVADSDSCADLLVSFGIETEKELQDADAPDRYRPTLVLAICPYLSLLSIGNIIELSTEKARLVTDVLRLYLDSKSVTDPAAYLLRDDLESILVLLGVRSRNTVRVEWAVPKDTFVYGNKAALFHVWFSLIKNALQAMAYAGTLRLSADISDSRVEVQVQDDGPGIPEDLQHRVFTPFFTTKSDGDGMGLGLAVCKRIVARHGGSIFFQSEPGKTRFTVSLPRLAGESPA